MPLCAVSEPANYTKISCFQNDSNVQLGLQPLIKDGNSVQLYKLCVSLGFSRFTYKIRKNDTCVIGKFEELNVTVVIKLLSILFGSKQIMNL